MTATVITVINQKGGVGKTTTVDAIGAGLAVLKGYNVLFVDLDPQRSLTYAMGAETAENTALEMMNGERTASKVITRARADIIAGSETLALMQDFTPDTLVNCLLPIKKNYDYIIIDTPPTVSPLLLLALAATDHAVIPAKADIFSLQGIAKLSSTISAVRAVNPSLQALGIVLTQFNRRTLLAQEVREILTNSPIPLFKTAIRENNALRVAQAQKQDIFTFDKRSNGANDYAALVDEILERSGASEQ